ncbi:hypothetical protein [Neorhodopirellula pilleata]|uniref:Uncharacterized protein n=1 Tax=Neorhodopirellula pilleata TaxID=2714738 RepID=A0A5C6ATN0_9BACT|nr:hypothetical protein [Neorhodopirellula pilleata]TWU01504.1 hypothetical protein Pla100_12390 [Neorhodopirellula pilleata]
MNTTFFNRKWTRWSQMAAVVAVCWVLTVATERPANAQSLPGYGTGYGFTGGVGWGQLPSTPPSQGSGLRSQFNSGQTYRLPAQSGYRYGAYRYGYPNRYPQPVYSPYGYGYGNYGYGAVPYGYGYFNNGVQLNTYPGGVIQTFQGVPIR